MHTEVIKVDTVDRVVERILQELKEDEATDTTSSGRHNVIYFDGWDGLGASAVLREVGQRLTKKKPAPAAGLEFSQVIHIDCSKWESRRAMQRALADQLRLPDQMDILDMQDEEDDYKGVGRGSRAEIPKVSREIYEHLQKQPSRRLLVIFNNGSCEEINLEKIGFPPLSEYSRNKVLWSFQGGFRLYPRTKVDRALESTMATDVVLSAACTEVEMLSNVLRHEAEEVARGMVDIGGIDWPAAASNCFQYTMRLCGMVGHLINYDLATHGSNYWICDGIVQLNQEGDDGADALWLSSNALKRRMQLDEDLQQSLHSASLVAMLLHERTAYWTSPTYGSMLIMDQHGHVPRGMFQQYDKLCVLKLSRCTFSIRSPPFLCCHNLRLLWLDYCQDESGSTGGAGDDEDIQRCFQKLWVLDVRYSSSKLLSEKMMDFMTQLRELHVMGQEEFDMGMLQGHMHNIRKLRVTKSKTMCSKGEYLLEGKAKMEVLELSRNVFNHERLVVESSCSSLETVIIDGASSLPGISLKGCTKLKNLLLSGSFPNLYSLDLTGTAVKTLDLSAAMTPTLDELFLLDCGKLRAILWPPPGEGRWKYYLGKLQIDTTTQNQNAAAGDAGSRRSPAGFGWYIRVGDARLLGSLEPVDDYFGHNDMHLEVSSSSMASRPHAADAGGIFKSGSSRRQVKGSCVVYADVVASLKGMQKPEQADGGDSAAGDLAIMWICPPAPKVSSSRGCYMHILDMQMTRSNKSQGASRIATIVPRFVCDGAKILHVHDSLFVTRILMGSPFGPTWNQLEWCRVERCPNLEEVFSEGRSGGAVDATAAFSKLRTMWVSCLLNARCVFRRSTGELKGLTLLHLYCCPRMQQVFSTCEGLVFQNLGTLEVMWCGDLRVIFHATIKGEAEGTRIRRYIMFPKLKCIHLHELPMLHSICCIRLKRRSLLAWAPILKTVKIRGCWSLTRAPPIASSNGILEYDCEKEWWDRLEWDSMAALTGHNEGLYPLLYYASETEETRSWHGCVPSRSYPRLYVLHLESSSYKPTYPRYYKKPMLRGSPLRYGDPHP